MSDLPPCRKCGGEGKYTYYSGYWHEVGCKSCGYVPKLAGTAEDAIAAWRDPPIDAAITDGFGQFWPSRCPDCGAEMQIERPGRATCSNECWITPAEGAAETPKGE